jgi:hypothetical protein
MIRQALPAKSRARNSPAEKVAEMLARFG